MEEKAGKTIDEVVSEKQRQMMEEFVKMMSSVWGEENCQKWYENFLKQDSSILEKYKNNGEGLC